MGKELYPGIKGEKKIIVTEDKTAKALGSGGVDVFATPAMIALMEQTCRDSVQKFLDEGFTTVGTLVNVKHINATPVGKEVKCFSELTEVNGKQLVFKVEAYDDKNKIGEGIHERFIVNLEKFMSKLV